MTEAEVFFIKKSVIRSKSGTKPLNDRSDSHFTRKGLKSVDKWKKAAK